MRQVPWTCPKADAALRMAKRDASSVIESEVAEASECRRAIEGIEGVLDNLHETFKELREDMRAALCEADEEVDAKELEVRAALNAQDAAEAKLAEAQEEHEQELAAMRTQLAQLRARVMHLEQEADQERWRRRIA